MRSPRTPPTSNEPHLFFVAPNRKSTDSWNSSNQDYELDSDWKPDHLLLLSRTLDALPAHLLTPFNGSVPPSNLLDKIARGVANAKGPIDWPHSIRATRVKLMELARLRAKESAPIENRRRHRIPHEDDYPYPGGEVLQQSTNTLSRRPLYRQSSMDFLNTAKVDNDNIARLSTRLQRTDRLIPNPAYHPYSRPSLPRSSPSNNTRTDPPHYLNPSTSSTSALNSSLSSSSTSRPRPLSRSASTLSNTSDPYLRSMPPMIEDSRVQRLRRTDSLGGKGMPLKRAPSFGLLTRDNRPNSPCTSSDEEEKIRTKYAKKLRTKAGISTQNGTSTAPSTPNKPRTRSNECVEKRVKTSSKSSCSTSSSSKSSSTARSSDSGATTVTLKSSRCSTPKIKPNLQRNYQNIFGAELPDPHSPPPRFSSNPPGPPPTPGTASPCRPLRRVRATSFARAPARRINFGSLIPPPEENEPDAEAEGEGLGSAFQLR
jgi:transcription factor SPN1